MMRIEVLISSYGEDGLKRLLQSVLPAMPGLSYTVGVQGCDNFDATLGSIGALAAREDVRFVNLPGRGLSRSRNALLDRAVGDILIIGDDDIDYLADGLEAMRDFFAANPSADMAIGRFGLTDRSVGGDKIRRLKPGGLRGVYAPSWDMALRRTSLGGLRLCEALGVGTDEFPSGEDDIFLHSMLSRGSAVYYVPATFAVHRGASTVDREQTPAILRTRGLVLALIHPHTWPLRAILLSLRLPASPLSNLKHIWEGAHIAGKRRGEFLTSCGGALAGAAGGRQA